MEYYTERQGMRKPIERTYDITPNMYSKIIRLCEGYYDNIAWKFPKQCDDGHGVIGVNAFDLSEEIMYEIPNLYLDDKGLIGIPVSRSNIFEEGIILDEYDQYALLDFIEYIAHNVRDVEFGYYHKYYDHHHLNILTTNKVKSKFVKSINDCFNKMGLLYSMNDEGVVERVIDNNIVTPDAVHNALSIKEKGTKELLQEAIDLHRSYNPREIRNSVEKLWDAFERLKTYYIELDKKQSINRIIEKMSNGQDSIYQILETEFYALTDIGNNFRIRHHETDKIEIEDLRLLDYLFNRCFSLISLAVQYLEEENAHNLNILY